MPRDSEVITQFVKQFYTEAATIPRQVMLPEEIEEARIISQWLRSRRGAEAVEFIVPKEGQPQQLVQMAAENASETLAALRAQWQADAHKQEQALGELQSALGLCRPSESHRVLRRLQHAGHRHRGCHGRLRARRSQQEPVSSIQHRERRRRPG